MADGTTGGSKELGLGVIFTATIAGFEAQLTAIQNQLKAFASQLEAFGKTGEKAMAGLAKATEKANKEAATAATTAKKSAEDHAAASASTAKAVDNLTAATSKSSTALEKHGRSSKQVQEEMANVTRETARQIAASNMSLPVYDALQKRMSATTGEASNYKKALAALAMEPNQTAIGFNNLANALVKNEKALLESRSSMGNWATSADRVNMAHASLSKELYKSGEIITQAGKTANQTSSAFAALERQFGTDNVNKYKGAIGSTINTMGEFKTALAENQKAQIVANTHTIAAEKAITATQIAMNAMTSGSGDAWRKGVNESAVAAKFLRGELANANGTILEAGKSFNSTRQSIQVAEAAFQKTGDAVRLTTNTIKEVHQQLGSGIGTIDEYKQALATSADRAKAHADVNAIAGEAVRKLGINSAASASSVEFLANQVMKGNVSFEAASRIMKTHSNNIIAADKASSTLVEGQARLNASFGSLMSRTDEYGTRATKLYDSFVSGNKSLAETRILMQGVSSEYQSSIRATSSLEDASTKLNSKFRELLSTTNTYNGAIARGLISNLKSGGVEATVLGDTFQRMNQDLIKYTAETNKWNETIKKIPTSNVAATAEVSRLQSAIASGTITAGQATTSIKEFTKAVETKTQAVKTSTDSFKNFASGIMGGGAAANMAVGYFTSLAVAIKSLAAWIPAAMIIGGLTQMITGAIAGVKQFDQALKNVKAIAGGTDAEIALLGDEMIKLSNNTKYSATEISKGAIFIAQAGFTAGETLQVIGAAAKLAQGTLSDMSMSADLLTTVLRVFHIEGRQAANVADMLAVAANKSKTDIQGLRVAFNYLGPVAQATGMSLQGALASTMALANAGIRMSTVGTGMRQILSRLENPTMKLKMAMDEAGLSAEDFNFKTKSLGQVAENMSKIIQGDAGNALKFFGERAGNQALVISNLGLNMNVLVGYLGELGAANKMASIQTEGLAVKLAILSNRFENMFIQMTSGGITDVLKSVISGLTTLVDWFTILIDNSFVKFLAVLGIVKVSVGILIITLRTLLSLALSNWLNTSRMAIVSMMNSMGIWQTIITAVQGTLYQLSNTFAVLLPYVNNLKTYVVNLGVSFSVLIIQAQILAAVAFESLIIYASNLKTTFVALASQFQIVNVVIAGLSTAFSFLWAIIQMAATPIAVLVSNLWLLVIAKTAVIAQSRAWIVVNQMLVASLGLLGTAIKGVLASSTFWLMTLSSLILYLVSSSNAKEKEIILLEKQTLKYQESAEVLKGYANELESLGKSQAEGNDVSLQNLTLLQKIRAAYPELNAQLFKSTVSIKEQADAVRYLSLQYEWYTKQSIEKTTIKIVESMQEGAKVAKIYQDALDSNVTVWQALKVAILDVMNANVSSEEWWMNVKLVFALIVDGAMGTRDAVTMLTDGIVSANSKVFSSYERLASYLTTASPEIQKSILATLPSDLARERVNALIAMNLEYQAMLKQRADYSDEMAKSYKKNIETLGEEWITYYQQQDAAGLKVVENAAIHAQKLIELEEKKFIKAGKTADAEIIRTEAVAKIQVDILDKLVTLRTKQVDEMLKLLNAYYTNEEKAIKTSAENQINNLKLSEQMEIASLDVRLLGQEKFVNRKSEIELSYVDRQKALVDKEAADGVKAASDSYERQKTFLSKQTSLKEDSANDTASRLLIVEQSLADKTVAIYTTQLGHYKTMITSKLAEVERHKTAALKAEEDIVAALAKASSVTASLEEDKRKASQLTMTSQEKAKDDILQFAKLVSLGEQALSDSRINISAKEKDAKIKMAEDYFNQAKSLNNSLVDNTQLSSGKVTRDDEDTKRLRLANIAILEGAFNNLRDQTIANFNTTKTAEIEATKQAQTAANTVIASYKEVSDLLSKAVEIQVDNAKALAAIDALAQKIFGTSEKLKVEVKVDESGIVKAVAAVVDFGKDLVKKSLAGDFKVLLDFKATASEEGTLSQKIEEIKRKLTKFSEDIVSDPIKIVISFMGTVGGTNEKLSIAIETVKTMLNSLVTWINMELKPLFSIISNVEALSNSIMNALNALTISINKMEPVYTITTKYVTSGSVPSEVTNDYGSGYSEGGDFGVGSAYLAEGGSVPGTGSGDTVPAMLTPGEFVIQAPIVRSLGEGFFNFINGLKSFSMPTFNMSAIPAFAGGGSVGKTSHEIFTINLQAGSAKLPLQVVGNPNTMRSTIKMFERELSKMKLSRS